MRSSLSSAARSRARRDRFGLPAARVAFPSPFLPARAGLASAKAFRHILERHLEVRFIDLDLTKPCPERNAANALCLSRFRVLELFLEPGDFFADFGGWLLHLWIVL
jgi:hypothetical protein